MQGLLLKCVLDYCCFYLHCGPFILFSFYELPPSIVNHLSRSSTPAISSKHLLAKGKGNHCISSNCFYSPAPTGPIGLPGAVALQRAAEEVEVGPELVSTETLVQGVVSGLQRRLWNAMQK